LVFYHSVLRLFPRRMAEALHDVITGNSIRPEEIRIKINCPIIIRYSGRELHCNQIIASADDIAHILVNATDGAFHAALDEMRNGYLSISGGCRLGICGEGVTHDRKIYNIRNVNSMCIRFAEEKIGCADMFFSELMNDSYKNTIIIAPPGLGKTTLLREIIRKLSSLGVYVGVADERGEISGIYQGKSAFDLGVRTDVITGLPKNVAAEMIIRAMAPDVLAMDEVTSVNDLPAITQAIGCGIGLLTTIHGRALSDLTKPAFRSVYELNVFERAVIIEMVDCRRVYKVVKLNV